MDAAGPTVNHSTEGLLSTPRTRRRVATGAILGGLVVAAFEGTVVTTAMPTIAQQLGGLRLYAWVFSAFLIASTVGVLVCGRLADRFGRKPVFIGGMAIFLAGSALCGFAPTMGWLVAFRAIQGIGAGAIQPIAMTISADLYTLAERVRVQTLFTSAWGAANVLGPVIGGWIVMHLSWRWVFLVNVPVGVLAAGLLAVSYTDPPRARGGPTQLLPTLAAGISAALFIFALEPARGVPVAGRLGFGALAALCAAGVWLWQRRARVPLVPASVLADRVVRAGIASGLFAGGLLYTCAAYVPLWMTQHAHRNAITAGAALVPLLAGWAVGSSFGVGVLVKRGMRTSVAGGFAVASLGAAGLAAVVVAGWPVPFALASLAVLGVGLGPAASTSLLAPQTAVSWQHRGVVTSLIYATRTLGGSLAVAALAAIVPTTPGADVAARFVAVAVLAVAALITLGGMAPRGLPVAAEMAPTPGEG